MEEFLQIKNHYDMAVHSDMAAYITKLCEDTPVKEDEGYICPRDIRRKLNFIRKKIYDLRHQRKFAYTNSVKVKKMVHNQVNQIVKCLRARERSLLADVDEAYISQDANINEELNKIESVNDRCSVLFHHIGDFKESDNILSKIHASISEISLIIKDNKPLELISEFEEMKERASNYGRLEGDYAKRDHSVDDRKDSDLSGKVGPQQLEEENSVKFVPFANSVCGASSTRRRRINIRENSVKYSPFGNPGYGASNTRRRHIDNREEYGPSCRFAEYGAFRTSNSNLPIVDLTTSKKEENIEDSFQMIHLFDDMCCDDINEDFVMCEEEGPNCTQQVEKNFNRKSICGIENKCVNVCYSSDHCKEGNKDFNSEEEWKGILEMKLKMADFKDVFKSPEEKEIKSKILSTVEQHGNTEKFKQKRFMLLEDADNWLHSASSKEDLKRKNTNIASPAELIQSAFKPYFVKDNAQKWLSCN